MSYALCTDYEHQVPALQRILTTSQKTQWSVTDIDWTREVADGHYGRILEWQGALRSRYVTGLPAKKREQLAQQFVAFDFSQILHGEQCAMMLAAQLVNCVEDIDAKLYASVQTKDEARHVESVRKLLHRIGPIYGIGPVLKDTFELLINTRLWTKQVLGLQLFLEARALLTFRQHLLFVDDPVFQEVIHNMELDESQHVAFGIQYIARGIETLSPTERQELVDYGVWLDHNVWSMTRSAEYRAVFEECDLDFDEFEASYHQQSFLRPSQAVSCRAAKSVEGMHQQFHRWFYGALHRVGLTEVIERRLGRPVTAEDLRGAGESAVLPWLSDAKPIVSAPPAAPLPPRSSRAPRPRRAH
jgi:hypothetical protein